MNLVLGIFLIMAPTKANAVEKKEHHHSHKAHHHHHAEMEIVLEGNDVHIRLEAPASDIYGFEHEAKTDEQKQKIDDAFSKLRAGAPHFVTFDGSSSCSVENIRLMGSESSQSSHKSPHRDVVLRYVLRCPSAPTGSKLKFGLSALFPSIKAYSATIVSGDKQNKIKVEKDRGDATL